MPRHLHPIRVYYEDTDAGGIVYHSCYLNFAERARTEMVRDLGISQQSLLQEGTAFAVRRAVVDFLRPARLDDLLTVETELCSVGGASLDLAQTIRRNDDGTELVRIEVRLGYITLSGRPTRLPAAMRDLFGTWISERQ
ncbi:tol-pal system-associated acyl-CoA thioesterase [Magnetospirillum molischianum]|uniref:Thioesterase superfamily:4-hydroxybenzoyl-CoA thioesterase n=1 Tax=Magnetospirillum molischianum DSM 120 TaxID=1150626 RepID=H8FNV4_MAGML|nr:tol-pal system-associated acyl-CoA thioesterase [Magnetospirillum molischianum]CCG40042.1 Thioesterase superfamily:4-hydroxybenzoyl-CoA thioesterase [Magnetospirillum molischianum DSM 120]